MLNPEESLEARIANLEKEVKELRELLTRPRPIRQDVYCLNCGAIIPKHRKSNAKFCKQSCKNAWNFKNIKKKIIVPLSPLEPPISLEEESFMKFIESRSH